MTSTWRLSLRGVDVWAATVDAPALQEVALDDTEAGRLERMRDRMAREHFAGGARLLRAVARRATGCREVEVDRTCACGSPHGPPSVIGSELRFSVAHERGLVCVAVTRNADVGVDCADLERAAALRVKDLPTPTGFADGDDWVPRWAVLEAATKAWRCGLHRVQDWEIHDAPPRARVAANAGALVAHARRLPDLRGCVFAVAVAGASTDLLDHEPSRPAEWHPAPVRT